MDGGVAAHFAKRLGVRKSTVHYWQTGRTLLTLDAAVRMAMHCGVSLPSLLQGELSDWCPSPTTQQLALQLDYPASNRHRPKRQHNWGAIRQQLQDELNQVEPRNVMELAKTWISMCATYTSRPRQKPELWESAMFNICTSGPYRPRLPFTQSCFRLAKCCMKWREHHGGTSGAACRIQETELDSPPLYGALQPGRAGRERRRYVDTADHLTESRLA